MAKIELNTYDFTIKKLKSTGDEVCQLAPQLAFNPDFIAEMRSLGVKDQIIREEEDNNED